MSLIHFDVLNNSQIEIFEKLKIFKKDAVLAGGTSLALQIKHRYSYDFDLFFKRKLDRRDILKLRKSVKIKEIGLNTEEQINIITGDNVRLNLVFYPFKPLFKKIKTFSLQLFSVKDIALDKAYTIGRRALWRDYVDLFFLLKDGYITISEIFKFAHKKFGFEFNEKLFLEQLIYFRDLEITKISFCRSSFSDSEIKKILLSELKKQKKKIL